MATTTLGTRRTTTPVGIHVTGSARRSQVLLRTARHTVHLTTCLDDIDEVQRLRHAVFSAEPGFAGAMVDARDPRDADRWDDHCDHLLVRDVADGSVVGCTRLLTPAGAVAAGGRYSATEFDLGELAPIAAETVEMGRACVARGHRTGAVTALLWSSVLWYLEETGHRYISGCTSVPVDSEDGLPPGATIRGVRDRVRDRHRAPWQVFPHRPVVVDGVRLDDIAPPPSLSVPPLLAAYLRLGARVCGEPAYDVDFGVGDFLTVLDRDRADLRHLDRLRALARRCDAAAPGRGEPTGGRR